MSNRKEVYVYGKELCKTLPPSNKKEVYLYGTESQKNLLEYICGDLYKFQYDNYFPDILWIRSMPGYDRQLWRLYRRILRLRLLFGWQRILCYYSNEESKLPRSVDYSISYSPDSKKNGYWVYCLPFGYAHSMIMNLKDEDMKKWHRVRKTRFCNFIYSNKGRDTWVRRDFCDLLSKYKRVDCPGGSLNNMPRLIFGASHHSPESIQAKLGFMAECKFTIAFENTSTDYYITEKIFHAFAVGSVPIYWGCPGIAKFFNPAAFINCHDYASFDDVVTRIREIDSDPDLYESYRQAQPILLDSHFYVMKEKIREKCISIIEEALSRRNKKENYLLSKIRLIGVVVGNLDLEIKSIIETIATRLGVHRYLYRLVTFLRSIGKRKRNPSF